MKTKRKISEKGLKNLIPNNKRSKDEVRKNARKGGISSGRKRAKLKTLKQYAKIALSALVTDEDTKKKIPVALAGFVKMAKNFKETGDPKYAESFSKFLGEEQEQVVKVVQTKDKATIAQELKIAQSIIKQLKK